MSLNTQEQTPGNDARQPSKKRAILILIAGIAFLGITALAANLIDLIVPLHTTAPIQTAQAGPYQVTIQVSPDPPATDKPATLAIQVVNTTTHQPISKADIKVENTMESMDMGTDIQHAVEQTEGTYITKESFSMNGTWSLRITINAPNMPAQQATFEIIM